MNLALKTPDGMWSAALITDDEITEEYAEAFAKDHAETLGVPTLIPVISEDDPRTGDLLDVGPELAVEAPEMQRAIRPTFTDEEITFLKDLAAKGMS